MRSWRPTRRAMALAVARRGLKPPPSRRWRWRSWDATCSTATRPFAPPALTPTRLRWPPRSTPSSAGARHTCTVPNTGAGWCSGFPKTWTTSTSFRSSGPMRSCPSRFSGPTRNYAAARASRSPTRATPLAKSRARSTTASSVTSATRTPARRASRTRQARSRRIHSGSRWPAAPSTRRSPRCTRCASVAMRSARWPSSWSTTRCAPAPVTAFATTA